MATSQTSVNRRRFSIFNIAWAIHDDADDESFLWNGWPTKDFNHVSRQGHCQGFWPWQFSDTPPAGFEPAQNQTLDFVAWRFVVVIITTSRRHLSLLDKCWAKTSNFEQLTQPAFTCSKRQWKHLNNVWNMF